MAITSPTPSITLFLCLLSFCSAPLNAATGDRSEDGLWTEIAPATLQTPPPYVFVRTNAFLVLELNEAALAALLQQAPMEQPGNVRTSLVIVTIPLPTGGFGRFRIVESPILSRELAQQHPELRTFLGQGIDEPTASVRFDRTPAGFHAMVRSLAGTVYVDPYSRGDTQHYLSFFKHDLARAPNDFKCSVLGGPIIGVAAAGAELAPVSGANLRIFRLAMTGTGEYTTFFGGVAGAQAQITTSINRVTEIYEQEVAIRFSLVAFNVYANAATDPFPAGTSVDGPLLSQNQTDLDANVGSGSYDIGHIVSRGGGGGLASLGVVCAAGAKGQGGTSRGTPSGDPFDVDYLAHEIGHQLNGDHTFNGTTGSCGGGNRAAASAYEPGSGTTIMAYAGICGAEDVEANSDPFFHKRSFEQIVAYRDGPGASCGVGMPTGNNPPTVNAGPDYTIPTGTPFVLTAAGNDPDGDPITFAWDQYDLGSASPPPNNADGPLFRSRPPTTSTSRTFPRLADILSGAPTPWEILPTVNRTLNFRAVARDNRAGGGGVSCDDVVITVSGSPFRVISPNGGETLHSGCPTTVTWEVGGGSVAPTVNILVSADGGNSYTMLAPGVPNNGSAIVTLPCTNTTTARVLIQAVGNIFFDVSDADFSVTPIAPTIACNVVGGPVNDDCERLVTFSATITDDCCIDTNDVTITIVLLTANATLGVPTASFVQTTPTTITVSGSVLVSGLTGSPATVQVQVDAADCCGASASCVTSANVVDLIPPKVTCSVAQPVLWPPNHRMVNVGLTATALDNCSGVLPVTVKVFGDEDDEESTGDGRFSPDASNIAPSTLRLRHERKGNADGRVYLVVVSATDPSGNTGFRCCTVVVPHSNNKKGIAQVQAQAAKAEAYCLSHNGAPPPGFFIIGNSSRVGPKR